MEITMTLAQITNRAAIYEIKSETHEEELAQQLGPEVTSEVYLPHSHFPTDPFTIQFPKTIKITAEGGPGTEWVTLDKRTVRFDKSTLWIQEDQK